MSDSKAARRARFLDVFSVIRDELVEHIKQQGLPESAAEWYRRTFDYYATRGKLNRGMAVIDTVEILKRRSLTDDEYFKAAVLGWCVELFHAFFFADTSITRLFRVNDSLWLGAAIYRITKAHFREQPYYIDIVELFQETKYQTRMGELIEFITAPKDHVHLSTFSLEKHRLIVVFKTAYYSFYLPVALALHMCNIPESYIVPAADETATVVRPYDIAREILIAIGEYSQIQDDFLDYSGAPPGKIGTDIVENKCSWCISKALSLATAEQRAVLEENYGRKDLAKEARVKEVYEQVGLRQIYAEYEENAYQTLSAKIAEIPESAAPETLKREVFTSFLHTVYKRTSLVLCRGDGEPQLSLGWPSP